MNSKLTILVICATVAQNSLVVLTSDESRIQNDPVLDYTILEAYRTVSGLQCRRGVKAILTIALQGYTTKLDGRAEDSTEDDLHTIKNCEAGIAAPFIAGLDAFLQGILLVDTEASHAVNNARITCRSTTKTVIANICDRLKSVLGKNPSEDSAESQVIARKQASESVTYCNAAMYNAIRNDRNDYNVGAMMKSAEKKSAHLFMSAVSNMFKGAETLSSSGSHIKKKNVFRDAGSILDQSASDFFADLEIKFNLLKICFTVSRIIQIGFVADESLIQTITEPAFSDNEKATKKDWSTCKKDERKLISCDRSEIINKNRHCNQSGRKRAVSEFLKIVKLIFTVMETLAKIPLKKENVCENDYLEKATARTTATYAECLNACITPILTINSKASSAISAGRLDADSALKKAVRFIYDGIALAKENHSSKVLTKIQALQSATFDAFSAVVKDVYDAILLEKIPTDIRHKIERTQKETISQLKIASHGIFKGLRSRLAEVTSGTEVESNSGKSPFELAHAETSAACKALIEATFDGMAIVCKASIRDQVTLNENLSVIQSYRRKAVQKLEEAIGMVFTDISACIEISSGNKRLPEDASSAIQSANARSIALWKTLTDIIFSQVPHNHRAAILKDKSAASSSIEKVINVIFEAITIASTWKSDSPKTLNKLQALRNTTRSAASQQAVYIFAGIRESLIYIDAKTDAILNRSLNNTISIIDKLTKNVFDGIGKLLAAFSSGAKGGSKNYPSAIAVLAKETAINAEGWIDSIFDPIELLFSKDELSGGTCPVAVP